MGRISDIAHKFKVYERWTQRFTLPRVISLTFKTFAERAIGFQSVALSYFCTIAFVPLLAVAFAVTNGFGLEHKLREFIYSLDISQHLLDTLLQASSKILDSATDGIFGLISALTFIWLIIWMMLRVEKVFNNVWDVKESSHSFFRSLGIDIAIMLLLPFVVLLLYSSTILYSHILDLFPKWMSFMDVVSSFLGRAIGCGVVILVFSLMYKWIPSTKVYYKYAIKAAIISGIAFSVLQYLYLETQVLVMKTNAVYGTIAALPLLMMWLRYSWLIILYGAQFSYSFQVVGESMRARGKEDSEMVEPEEVV